MVVYWLMFLIPAFGSLFLRHSPVAYQKLFLLVLALVYILIVGLSYQVGCDWGTYLNALNTAEKINNFSDWGYVSSDIGFALLNYLVAVSGGSILSVNLICAIISMFGLYHFCKNQPAPILAFAVAVPYLIIVLFHGYTRQAVAFGFELLALTALTQSKNLKFVIYILAAATFHKTAIILLPLAALASSKNMLWSYFWVTVTTFTAYVFFIAEHQDTLWVNYVEADMESLGAGVRVAMIALPSVLFLIYSNKLFFEREEEKKLWYWISVLSLVCVPLVFFSSTAIDRIALYLLPIQLYVFCRLPILFPRLNLLITIGIIVFYFSVQFVWLNYAIHAHCWVPYKFGLFR